MQLKQGILAGLAVPAWAPTNEKIEVEEEKKEEQGQGDGGAAAPAAVSSSSEAAGVGADAMEVEAVAKDESEERAALAQLIAELEALPTEVSTDPPSSSLACAILPCL